jgi:hypothetical protein
MADETSSYLEAMRMGLGIGNNVVDHVDQGMRYRDRLKQQAQENATKNEQLSYERNKDAGLSVEELDEFKKTGNTPSRMGAKAQISGMQGQEKIDAAVEKAREEATKSFVKVNDVDRGNYKIAYGREMPKGVDSWHINQQKEVADIVKEKLKPVVPKGAGGTGLTDKQVSQNVDSLVNGSSTLSMLGGMGSQRARINAEYEDRRKKNPSLLPLFALENGLKAEQKRVATLNGTQVTNDLTAINQFGGAIDKALEKIDAIDAGAYVPYNKLKQYGAQEFASNSKYGKDLAVLKAMTSEAALQSSRVFSGNASTDIQFKNELERLNSAQSKEAFKSVAQVLKQIASMRKNSLLSMPAYTPGGGQLNLGDTLQKSPMPDGSTTAPSGGDGYRYMTNSMNHQIRIKPGMTAWEEVPGQ